MLSNIIAVIFLKTAFISGQELYDQSCPLVPYTADRIQYTLYSKLFPNEGISAREDSSKNDNYEKNYVEHWPCTGNGDCKWIFRKCGKNCTNNADIYVIESKKFRSKFMYVTRDRDVRFYWQDPELVCDADINFQWHLFKESCSGSTSSLSNSEETTATDAAFETYYIKSIGKNGWLWIEPWNRVLVRDCRFAWEFQARKSCGMARGFVFNEKIDRRTELEYIGWDRD